MTSMTNAEKIEFLNSVVFELEKNIYVTCLKLEINPETLNIETHNPEEFISLFSKNVHDHTECVIINRHMANLAAAKKKLDELNND